MNIVLCTDNKYLPHCLTVISSVCENNREEDIDFYIVHDNIEKTIQETVSLFYSEKYGQKKVNFIQIQNSLFKDFPFGRKDQTKYVSIATYYRLYLAELLPASVDKVIYFDCDVIVNGSLSALWAADISDVALSAVTDTSTYDIQAYNRLKYEPNLGYFNAGILFINLSWWRKNDALHIFLNFIKEHPDRLKWHDQDVLNYTLKDFKKIIPLTYNFQEGFLRQEIPLYYTQWNEVFETEKNPLVIHYTGRAKPWKNWCKNPYKNLYAKYRVLTPFPKYKLEKDALKTRIRQNLRNICVFFKICAPYIEPNPFRDSFEKQI